MNIFTIFTLSILVSAATGKAVVCHACINNMCHRKETVFEARQFSGQLAVDRTYNILYFHYKNRRGKDFTGAYDLDDIKFRALRNVSFTFGRAVNQDTRDVYMSGDRGIYKYNPITNDTKLYGLADKTVWHLQYHNTLYYSQFQKKGLSTFSDKKKSESITALSNYDIDDFIIDKNGDIFFLSNLATYVLRNGAKKAAIFEDEIYFLSTDANSEAYFIQPYTKAIYKLDYTTRRLEEIGALDSGSIVKFVFDSNNNLIYLDGVDQKLYYLMPNFHRCSFITKGSGKSARKFIQLIMK